MKKLLLVIVSFISQSSFGFTLDGVLNLMEYNIHKDLELPAYNVHRWIEEERVYSGRAGVPNRPHFEGDRGASILIPGGPIAQVETTRSRVIPFDSIRVNSACQDNDEGLLASADMTPLWSGEKITIKMQSDKSGQIFLCANETQCVSKVLLAKNKSAETPHPQAAVDLKYSLSNLQYLSQANNFVFSNKEMSNEYSSHYFLYNDEFTRKMLDSEEMKRLSRTYSYVAYLTRVLESDLRKHRNKIFDPKRNDPSGNTIFNALASQVSLINDQESHGIYQDPVLRVMLKRMSEISRKCLKK